MHFIPVHSNIYKTQASYEREEEEKKGGKPTHTCQCSSAAVLATRPTLLSIYNNRQRQSNASKQWQTKPKKRGCSLTYKPPYFCALIITPRNVFICSQVFFAQKTQLQGKTHFPVPRATRLAPGSKKSFEHGHGKLRSS